MSRREKVVALVLEAELKRVRGESEGGGREKVIGRQFSRAVPHHGHLI